MTQTTMEAYAEVDTILNLMDEKYIKEIPEKLRKLFKEKKQKSYSKSIVLDKPLEEQGLKKETLSILAVLNYNYWCKDEERKKQLIEIYSKNENIYQKELRKRYNPDNIFKNKTSNTIETVENSAAMVEYKESFFTKIKNWFKRIF